jgi:hypothetical protein
MMEDTSRISKVIAMARLDPDGTAIAIDAD